MDTISTRILLGTAGAGGEKVYVEDVFSTWLYTGTGTTQTITNGIDLAGEGGMVLQKRRSVGYWFLNDTENGADNFLYTNFTNALAVGTSGSSFNSDGFTIGAENNLHNTGDEVASWTFRKAEKFFDVVTYTGTGSQQSIAHGLGSTPAFIIVKPISSPGSWLTWHSSFPDNYMQLNSTIANQPSGRTIFVSENSTSFTLSSNANVNGNGTTYVAYVFAHDAGGFGDDGTESVIKCGTFTATLGNNVDLGFEPQFVLMKSASATGDWYVADTMRGFRADQDSSDQFLSANTSAAEVNSTNGLALTQTGFKSFNASSQTYIYVAIRRGPMKTPTDATEVFNLTAYTGNATANTAVAGSAGFPVDHIVLSDRDATSNGWGTTYAHYFISKILRGRTLSTTFTSAEVGDWSNYYAFDVNNDIGWGLYGGSSGNNYMNKSGTKYVAYKFRRAPGFFDVVAYTGTSSATTVSHNLGVAPELMIVKCRSAVQNWAVYASGLGNTKGIQLQSSNQSFTATYWNNTTPSSTSFSIGTSVEVNSSSSTYIAYLFATLPGVSKVGSYTGTGTTLQVDCGFTAGARFVLIKRTDSTGDWYVWDTTRGIVSGNDPYLLLNSTAAEVTNTDYIDPYSAGFEISSTAPAAINASGGSFIFLAIA